MLRIIRKWKNILAFLAKKYKLFTYVLISTYLLSLFMQIIIITNWKIEKKPFSI